MGMKDQSKDRAGELQNKAKDKLNEGRERAGQRGQQPQRGQKPQRGQQPQRGQKHENMRDIEDTEREMQDRFDRDYDA
ncbi:hypothetical protein AB5J72_20700 [Streptomyces sp. CG1]|uniref:hypothetical protein n=1 Tax=Streptomyces sp. CG1 TaxID=1287523 RepID=UPI0034E1ADFB